MSLEESKKSIYETLEYQQLLNKLKSVEIERNEIESINKKLLNDLKVYYEERIRILEMNNLSKSNWSNTEFENEMTKNYMDKSVECNLLNDLNLNELVKVTNSNRLLKNLNKSIKNELKKIKTELLEINIKRTDLVNMIENFNNFLLNENALNKKNKNLVNRFKNFESNTSLSKIKNEHLVVLHDKFDQQIVELSNLFLNEKIDLIFKHNQLIEDLNQKLIESKSHLIQTKDFQIQTDSILSTNKFFKGLENIEKINNELMKEVVFLDQEVQTKEPDNTDSDDYNLDINIDGLNMYELINLLTITKPFCGQYERIKQTLNIRVNDLVMKNKSLNLINDELKLIIAQMYEKFYDTECQNYHF
ncbi:unnamed protein product [Brachionus calyciflorus]|uniref:Uncharacterized protein n=1 Tax=Brachionus calyciflorus TaxID=104777 RepID=A0A813WM28_9BILA|nr:unnamed protein product [Brachionus calyciflorus]